MDKITLQNPVFAIYAIAASLMILKAVAMSWLTVVRMLQENSGHTTSSDIPAAGSPWAN
jgi:glutathione S-transferase